MRLVLTAFDPTQHLRLINSPHLPQYWVLRPLSQRDLILLLVHVCKSRFLDSPFEMLDSVKSFSRLSEELDEHWAP